MVDQSDSESAAAFEVSPSDAFADRIDALDAGVARSERAAHLDAAEWHLLRILELAGEVRPLDLSELVSSPVEQSVVDRGSKAFAMAALKTGRYAQRAREALQLIAEQRTDLGRSDG